MSTQLALGLFVVAVVGAACKLSRTRECQAYKIQPENSDDSVANNMDADRCNFCKHGFELVDQHGITGCTCEKPLVLDPLDGFTFDS